MKKIVLIMLVVVLTLMFLPSCMPPVSSEEYEELQSNLDDAEQEIGELNSELANLNNDYAALQNSYTELQGNYNSLLESAGNTSLENPTWSQLKGLLEADDTDELTYVDNVFDCTGFAITLRDNMWGYGIRCAYIEVIFAAGEGHALNAFQTTDKGLVYIDVSNEDMVAYVATGQPYGAIPIKTIQSSHIDCSGDPNEFWKSLDYVTYSNLFSYDYYLDYQKRIEFYEESIDAYNDAVHEYNGGSENWSYDQLTNWRDNLEELEEELGTVFYEALGTVAVIETYWN